MAKIQHTDFTWQVSEKWTSKTVEERIQDVRQFLRSHKKYNAIEVQSAFDNGHVVLRIEESMPANQRGLFLLELEEKIKQQVDVGITIWLEPVGDKSKLRQLRGVQVKK